MRILILGAGKMGSFFTEAISLMMQSLGRAGNTW